jgi:hypothetical protein
VGFQQRGADARIRTGAGSETPGAQAYELIWKPLEKALAGKTRIYLSPDGILERASPGHHPRT